MKLLSVSLIFLLFLGCNSKSSIDKRALKTELDSIYQTDQKYRDRMSPVMDEFGWNSPEMKKLWYEQGINDSINLKRIIEIVDEIGGYPGKSLVGEPANKATFYVLQHAPDSIQFIYLDLILEAARNNELDKKLAALYHDRYLMHKGEPQIYGTQIKTIFKRDSISDEMIESSFVWPITDTTSIDSIRKSVGLEPLEEYLNQFGVSRWD
jgi:hypothetical protein